MEHNLKTLNFDITFNAKLLGYENNDKLLD